MSLAASRTIQLSYGNHQRYTLEIDPLRRAEVPGVPPPNPRFRQELKQALDAPLEFPPLEQSVIPDDHVAIALDAGTPEAPALVAATWEVLKRRSVDPGRVTIVQPAPVSPARPVDPRNELPADVRDRIEWLIHNGSSETDCAYLATTTGGERIYLNRRVTEADVVVSIGAMGFDPLIGYRGTNSVFFPGLSTASAAQRAQGQGHSELGPDDQRPLRQLVDEVGWLLGTQFTIQVIPSTEGGVSDVLAGATEAVFRRGSELLAQRWLVEVEERPEIVVAAVDRDAGGHGWSQVAAAVATAHHLVARGGKIVVLTELGEELGPGLELLRSSETPLDAIRPLRETSPADLMAATQLASAADWAKVYLLSGLEGDLVEDLFLIPLANQREITRLLLGGNESCLFLAGAQRAWGQIHLAEKSE